MLDPKCTYKQDFPNFYI